MPSTRSVRFGGLDILFDERVLRPRPWTVDQAEWAAELLPELPAGTVLELCAGVGHLGLCAVAGTSRRLVLVDRNPAACDLARINAAAATDVVAAVSVREGLMERVLEPSERFALVIADPPWVPSSDTSRFEEDPLIAIDGGPDGLELARVCCRLIGAHLMDIGTALLQVGTRRQADAIGAHLDEHPSYRLELIDRREYPAGVILRLGRTTSFRSDAGADDE